VLVGALLCKPVSAQATAGSFSSTTPVSEYVRPRHHRAYRLAGLAWAYPARRHLIETPVGDVSATLHDDGSVSVQNVPARRWKKQVRVETAHGPVTAILPGAATGSS
jgi:4-hydroxyproline epimerase